jgi:hypothetical protein
MMEALKSLYWHTRVHVTDCVHQPKKNSIIPTQVSAFRGYFLSLGDLIPYLSLYA